MQQHVRGTEAPLRIAHQRPRGGPGDGSEVGVHVVNKRGRCKRVEGLHARGRVDALVVDEWTAPAAQEDEDARWQLAAVD